MELAVELAVRLALALDHAIYRSVLCVRRLKGFKVTPELVSSREYQGLAAYIHLDTNSIPLCSLSH